MNPGAIANIATSRGQAFIDELMSSSAARTAFRNEMNALSQSRVVQQAVIVQQPVTETFSIASVHGGACTLADIVAAGRLVDSGLISLAANMRARADRVEAGIRDGTITTEAQGISAFGA